MLNRHTLGIQKYIYRCSQSVFVSACASVEHHERVGPVHAGVVPAGSGRGSVLVRASQKEAGGGIVPAQCGRAETSQEPRSRETRPHSPAAQRGETDLNAEKMLSESTPTLTVESGVLTNEVVVGIYSAFYRRYRNC